MPLPDPDPLVRGGAWAGRPAAVPMPALEPGLPVVLVEPARARHFARGLGTRAKTDAIDLGSVLERRRQLLVLRDAEMKRRRLVRDRLRPQLEESIADLTKKVAALDPLADELILYMAALAATPLEPRHPGYRGPPVGANAGGANAPADRTANPRGSRRERCRQPSAMEAAPAPGGPEGGPQGRSRSDGGRMPDPGGQPVPALRGQAPRRCPS